MTTQGKRAPKTAFLCRITNENYDFLYVMARNGDTSLAKVLNTLIAEKRYQRLLLIQQQANYEGAHVCQRM